jgi:hypothetical protein
VLPPLKVVVVQPPPFAVQVIVPVGLFPETVAVQVVFPPKVTGVHETDVNETVLTGTLVEPELAKK